MKVIKLHPRFKLYQDGYTHAIRWDHWDPKIAAIEVALAVMLGSRFYNTKQAAWRGTFGSKRDPKTGYKRYFIAVRNESHLTMALLKAQQDSSK